MFHAIPTSVSEICDFQGLPVQVTNTNLDGSSKAAHVIFFYTIPEIISKWSAVDSLWGRDGVVSFPCAVKLDVAF